MSIRSTSLRTGCYLVFLCLVVYLARKNSILCIFCVTKDARTFILHFLIAILRKKSRHEKKNETTFRAMRYSAVKNTCYRPKLSIESTTPHNFGEFLS